MGDDAAELDIKLEEAESEIDDLKDKIAFYQRKRDDIEWRRQQLDGSDPKEDERLQKLVLDYNEKILQASMRMGHAEGVADELGRRLRAALGPPSEPSDQYKNKLQPHRPKLKR